MPARVATIVAALFVLGACSAAEEPPSRTYAADGIVLRVPRGWDVAGFSTTVFPRRLAVASYELPARAVEGDCGGIAAVRKLPADGALVILIAYESASGAPFPPRPRRFHLSAGEFAEYECFGASTMFRFRVRGRDLQAHVALGRDAGTGVREQALRVLDSLSVRMRPSG